MRSRSLIAWDSRVRRLRSMDLVEAGSRRPFVSRSSTASPLPPFPLSVGYPASIGTLNCIRYNLFEVAVWHLPVAPRPRLLTSRDGLRKSCRPLCHITSLLMHPMVILRCKCSTSLVTSLEKQNPSRRKTQSRFMPNPLLTGSDVRLESTLEDRLGGTTRWGQSRGYGRMECNDGDRSRSD